MAEKQDKSFKVFYDTNTKLIRYRSYNEFIRTCKDRFNIRQSAEVIFALSEDNTEVAEDCFDILEINTKLLLIIRKQHFIPEANIDKKKPKPTETTDRLFTSETSTHHSAVEGNTIHVTGSGECVSVKKDRIDVSGVKTVWEENSKEILKEKEINDHQLKEAFTKEGMQSVVSKVKARLDNWKNEVVTIAVNGRSGVGKSSFINAIRGDLNEDHPYFATVGHNECTFQRKSYQHPDNKQLIFWDLPGVGTKKFPRKTYLKSEELKLSSYDAFVIMTSDRFTQDEEWLAHEIKKMGKIFIFVRSKVDKQIHSDEQQKKKAGNVSDPPKIVDDVRKDCKKYLGEDIYLINNLNLQNTYLDFDELLDRLVNGFSGLKSEVLINTLKTLTPTFLEEKVNYLKKRIVVIGLISSVVELASIQCTSLILLNEIKYFRKMLGLSEDDFKALEVVMEMPVDELSRKFSPNFLDLPLLVATLFSSSDSALIMLAHKCVPFKGLPLAAGESFMITVSFLYYVLSVLKQYAGVVLRLYIQHTGKKVRNLDGQNMCSSRSCL